MKPTSLILALVASTPLVVSASNPTVTACPGKDFKGKGCKTYQMTPDKLNTCMDLGGPHYRGSSFGVTGPIACRLFRKSGPNKGCKDPRKEPPPGNEIGRDNQRATDWFTGPGYSVWTGQFEYRSFTCTGMPGSGRMADLPGVRVAVCAADDQVGYACEGVNAVV